MANAWPGMYEHIRDAGVAVRLAATASHPVTFDGVNRHPVGHPTEDGVAFMSKKEGRRRCLAMADGSGGPRRLTNNAAIPCDVLPLPSSWHLTVKREISFNSLNDRRRILGLHVHDGTTAAIPSKPEPCKMALPVSRWKLVCLMSRTSRAAGNLLRALWPGRQVADLDDGGSEPQWNQTGGSCYISMGKDDGGGHHR